MPSLWFVVPAHGRAKLARICLSQLRRTCDALTDYGIEATAVVVADDENLDTADSLGFATVRRDNRFLSQKFNDGFQFALDEKVNPRPADYVVPCGSDDWVDWRILTDLPGRHEVRAFQHLSFVREDGLEIRAATARNNGGCGIRIYPRHVMEVAAFRPADEDRTRACDTSALVNLTGCYARNRRQLRVVYGDVHVRQIVDWKSPSEQINEYEDILRALRAGPPADPFEELAGVYPDEALDEMRAYHGLVLAAA
jgi:glycosyltransferase involved in cell wall biosynthesis